MFSLRKNNCKYRKLFEYFRHFLHNFPCIFRVFLLKLAGGYENRQNLAILKSKISWRKYKESNSLFNFFISLSSLYDLKVPEIEILQETAVEHINKHNDCLRSNISLKNSIMKFQEMIKCYRAIRSTSNFHHLLNDLWVKNCACLYRTM